MGVVPACDPLIEAFPVERAECVERSIDRAMAMVVLTLEITTYVMQFNRSKGGVPVCIHDMPLAAFIFSLFSFF